jgi:hypothetical protein
MSCKPSDGAVLADSGGRVRNYIARFRLRLMDVVAGESARVTWLALDLARYYGGLMGFYIVGLLLLLFAFVGLALLRKEL